MKDLCTKKKYDSSQLNNEQLQAVLEYIRIYDKDWIDITLKEFSTQLDLFRLFWNEDEWIWTTDLPTQNAIELFEEEPNCCEINVNSMGRVEPKYPNYSFDKSDVYESAHDLIEKGKQHGLKIVVTFEKL